MNCKELYHEYYRLKEIKSQKEKEFNESIKQLTVDVRRFEEHTKAAFIEQKLYLPMSELKRYEGKIIYGLTLVLQDGQTHSLYKSHGMKVNKDGILYCLHDDEYDRAFYHDEEMYCGWDIKETKNNRYVGFYNVYLLDEKKFEKEEDHKFDPEFHWIDGDQTYVDKESYYNYIIERS